MRISFYSAAAVAVHLHTSSNNEESLALAESFMMPDEACMCEPINFAQIGIETEAQAQYFKKIVNFAKDAI